MNVLEVKHVVQGHHQKREDKASEIHDHIRKANTIWSKSGNIIATNQMGCEEDS